MVSGLGRLCLAAVPLHTAGSKISMLSLTHTHTHTHINNCTLNSSLISGKSLLLLLCGFKTRVKSQYKTLLICTEVKSSVSTCHPPSNTYHPHDHLWAYMHGHEYPGYDWVFEVSRFCVCACKHHIPFSVTWISPYPSFEKPEYASWSTPKEIGILLHVYILSRFLTAADCLRRRGFSRVM